MSSTNEDIRKKAADASKQMLGLLTSVAQRAGASAVGLSTPLSSSSASASSSAPSSSSASTAAAGMDADLGGGDKPSAATNPEDIPKEELLLLCMKMQKRMHAMEAKGQELVRKKTTLLTERRMLLDAVQNLVDAPAPTPSDDGDVDMDALFGLIASAEDVRRLKAEAQEKKLAELERAARAPPPPQPSAEAPAPTAAGAAASSSSASTAQVDALAQELRATKDKADADAVQWRRTEHTLREHLAAAQEALRGKSEQAAALQTELDAVRSKSEEKVLYLQMQVNSAKAREEEHHREQAAAKAQLEAMEAQIASLRRLTAEKDSAVGSNREVIEALQNKIFELEPEVERGKEKVRELERNVNAQLLLKAEQDALLTALRRDLKAMMEAREEDVRRLKELEEHKGRADSQHVKMAAMNDQLTVLQAAVEDKTALVTRLRAEAQASERNHAMRTAVLATTEAQLEAVRRDLAGRDAAAKEAAERAAALAARVAALEAGLDARARESEAQVASLMQTAEGERKRYAEVQAQARDAHEHALDACKRDYAKKSSLARALLSEREEEVRLLTARNEELQTEIASGAPNERRIFELAELQARREAMYGQFSDTRELAFQQLQAALAARDLDLARVQQSHTALSAEVSELRRHTKREGVNMDYLKNVILQYMSFPVQAPERGSLVPVIAMLLQFNVKEVAQVEKALTEPIWNQRPVKEVKRALSKASESPYALRAAPSSSLTPSSSSASSSLIAASRRATQTVAESKTMRSSLDSKCANTEVSV